MSNKSMNAQDLHEVLSNAVRGLVDGSLDPKTGKEIINGCGKIINIAKLQLEKAIYDDKIREVIPFFEMDEQQELDQHQERMKKLL
jgi:hypothetical protein